MNEKHWSRKRAASLSTLTIPVGHPRRHVVSAKQKGGTGPLVQSSVLYVLYCTYADPCLLCIFHRSMKRSTPASYAA